MTKKLPSRPNLEQLRKQAKALMNSQQAADAAALSAIRQYHPHWRGADQDAIRKGRLTLTDAQLVIARQYGFESWAKLKSYLLTHDVSGADPAMVQTLRDAAGQGDLEKMTALLNHYPGIVNGRGGQGVRTALHHAVFGNQQQAVKLLLEYGADPNIRCEGDYAYPLHFAAERQNLAIIRLLIEHGADPNGEGDYHELGVLGWATAWSYVEASREVTDYLLAHGSRHNIWSAVAMGDEEAIREIISRTPAELERRMDMVNHRRRPVHLAVVKKQVASLASLLDWGANIDSLDEAGLTALDQAALDGETAMAQMLLDRGAEIRLPAAVAMNRTRDLEKLMRRDPDCLKPGQRWGTLIVRAAERCSGEVIERLIGAGASVNVHDDVKTAVDHTSGYTPLHAAAFNGNLSGVEALLKNGADVTARESKWHGTPAAWANHAGYKKVGDRIRSGPVDLMEAVGAGLIDRVAEILRNDPEALNRRFDCYPLYPLYYQDWYTPLVAATVSGNPEMLKMLLAKGADPMVRSPEGKSLAELARESGHECLADLLRSDEVC